MSKSKFSFNISLALGLASFSFCIQAEDALASSQFSLGPYKSIQVNVDALGQNIVGDAANESSLAINPNNPDNIVIGWRQFDSVLLPAKQAGWAYTKNGGESWVFPGILPLTTTDYRTDPVLDVNSQGTFFYQSLHYGTSGSPGTEVFKSHDGGLTWQDPVKAFDGDKNWMAIDRNGGASDGYIYNIWRAGSNTNRFNRSIDSGVSFEAPVKVPQDNEFGTLTVAHNGDVYTAGRTATNHLDPLDRTKVIFDALLFSKSVDAKNPAVTPTLITSEIEMGGTSNIFISPNTPNKYGLIGQINVATDHSNESTRGNVYVLASLDPAGSDPQDVNFIRSTDGGETWSDPIRVNDDLPNENSWQWFATLDVAPNSRIDAVWFDTRNSGEFNISELFYAYSWDGGQTWSENIPVSIPFDSHIGFPAGAEKLGDYIDAVSDNSGINVAYAATFNGEQDVYFVNVFPDCNNNAISDVIDLTQASNDTNANHIPDECEVIVVPGDLDSDGDVDRNDMSIILASRNQPASGTDDPKDLNNDGMITTRDARVLRGLCTRSRCATE